MRGISIALLGVALLAGCDDDDCYSPTQNLDRAYEEGSHGCGCAAGSAPVCVRDSSKKMVGLVCEGGRWVAVEDGPCMPAFPGVDAGGDARPETD